MRYGVAAAAVALALLVQLLLSFLLADGASSYPFMVFFAAIMVGAYFGGLRPGLLATALSTVLAWYFFISPQYSFQLVGIGQGLRLVLFALEGAVISLLVGALHSARRRAEASARQAEEDRRRLHESEERYRAVIEQSAEGFYLVDADTLRILEANQTFQEMVGYTSEELVGREVHDLIALPREEVDAAARLTLKAGRRLVGERQYRRKDGTLVEVEVGASVISYGGRRVICAVVRDMTERRRAEEALFEVREAERNRIARDLHDGALQDLHYGMAEAQIVRTLSGDPILDERLDLQIEALRRATGKLREAVYDLRQEGSPEGSFVRSLESIVELNRRMNQGWEVELAVGEGVPDELPERVGKEILRVVQEALTNARKHSGAETVRINSKVEGEDLMVEVADDGRGFDPGAAGPGIGLKTMRERAESLVGELEVESEPGEGTMVRLRIPMRGLLRQGSETGLNTDDGDRSRDTS